MHRMKDQEDNTNKPLVRNCLKGLSENLKDKRPAITPQTLDRLNRTANECLDAYGAVAFRCISSWLFFGLFRISELLGDKGLNIPSLELDSVKEKKRVLTISLRSYKHSKGKGALVDLARQKNKHICPLRSFKTYIKTRGKNSNFLFVNKRGKPITKNVFAKTLKKVSLAADYNPPFLTHSFRIGGATQAHKMGYTEVQIKALGRWRSAAYAEYVRGSKPLILSPDK